MFSNNLQALMMIAGIGLMCWMMLRRRLQVRHDKMLAQIPAMKHNGNALSSAKSFSGAASVGAPAEALRWQVELFELARQLKAELDSKIVAVRKITGDYDQAARRLEQLIGEARSISQQRPTTEPLVSPQQLAERLTQAGWPRHEIAAILQVAPWHSSALPTAQNSTNDYGLSTGESSPNPTDH